MEAFRYVDQSKTCKMMESEIAQYTHLIRSLFGPIDFWNGMKKLKFVSVRSNN